MSGLLFLVATWKRWISYENGCARLLVLTASLEPLAHHQNIAGLSVFYNYYFGRCSSLPYFRGRSARYSDRLHDFSVTIPKCCKNIYVNSFFLCTSRLGNFLPMECFPLTYDLNGFKGIVKWADPCKCVILLVSRTLWQENQPFFKIIEILIFDLTRHFRP